MHRPPLGPRLGLGQPAPGDFGVREDHGRDGGRLKRCLVAGDHLDGRPGLVTCFVREHRLTHEVAHREDRRLPGSSLPVDDHEALRVTLDAGSLETRNLRVGGSAHRHQHPIEYAFGPLDPWALERYPDAVALLRQPRHRRLEQYRLAHRPQPTRHHGGQVAVGARQQPGRHLDHGDRRAQRSIDRPELEPDVAATDDKQRARHPGHLEGPGRVPYPVALERQPGRRRRPGAGRQDGVLKLQICRVTPRRGNPGGGGSDELGPTAQIRDPTLGGQLPQPTGQLADDPVLPGPESIDVDGRLTEIDTPGPCLARLGQHLRDVQQCFRRHAAPIQTDSAWVGRLVDQRDLHPQIRCQKRGGVAPGATTDHHELCRVRHLRSRRECADAGGAPKDGRRRRWSAPRFRAPSLPDPESQIPDLKSRQAAVFRQPARVYKTVFCLRAVRTFIMAGCIGGRMRPYL